MINFYKIDLENLKIFEKLFLFEQKTEDALAKFIFLIANKCLS